MIHSIRELNLSQIGCGLDIPECTRVLNTILRLYANTDIGVNIVLQKVQWNSNFDNAFFAEESSNDEETRKKFFPMAMARKLALEAMLQTPPKIDQNNRDAELRAFKPDRRFQFFAYQILTLF